MVGITDDELAEYAELQAHFGELLRDGTVSVHLGNIEYFLDEDTTKIETVMNTAGMSAGGLARSIDAWRGWGYVYDPGLGTRRVRTLARAREALVVGLPGRRAGESGPGRRRDLLIAFRTCVSCQVGDFGAPG